MGLVVLVDLDGRWVQEPRGILGNQHPPLSRCILGILVDQEVLRFQGVPAVLEVLGILVFPEDPESLSVLVLLLLPGHPFLQGGLGGLRFQGNQSLQEVRRIPGNQVHPFDL